MANSMVGSIASASAARPSWLTYGFDAQRTGYNPSETTIAPGNAGGLHVHWRINLGAVMIAQPVEAAGVNVAGVATDVVYEGTEHGDFYALRASDGHVLWHKNLGSVQTTDCADMPDGVFGIGGAAAIHFVNPGAGALYVAGGDGAVHAFDLATGSENAGWPVKGVFDAPNEHVYGALNLVAGRLYVTVASHCDNLPYSGKTVEISVLKHVVTHRFYPAGLPSGGFFGGGIWGPGGAAVEPATGHVFVATGNAIPAPQNYHYSEATVELSSSLSVLGWNKPTLIGDDVDFGATPILFRPAGCPVTLVAAKNKSGVLVVYAEGALNAGYRQRLQMADVTDERFNGIPAWDPATNMLYVSNSTDSSSGTYLHGLVALKAAPSCGLSLAWQRSVGPYSSVSPPSVANGVVYYGDGTGGQEFAFNAATGAELWNSGSAAGPLFAAPTVANGSLFVASWDHYLYAFGL